jgi:hypothetical protein
MESKVRSTGSGNINSMINYLYTSGRDDTSTASSDDSSEDFRYEKNHPLCIVLPRVHLDALFKSALAKKEKEIVDNFDIFINCIVWHTKKGKYAPSTKITAKAMQEQYYLYKGLPFLPMPAVTITRADMKTTEEPEEDPTDSTKGWDKPGQLQKKETREKLESKKFKHSYKFLSLNNDKPSNSSESDTDSSEDSDDDYRYKYLYKYKQQNKASPLFNDIKGDDNKDTLEDSEEEKEESLYKYKYKYEYKYKDVESPSTEREIKLRNLPVPPPPTGLRKRNSAGPFLSKEELCRYFPFEDFSAKFKRKMLIAEGAFGSVNMGEEVSTQNVVAIKTTKLRKEPARIHNIAMEIYLMQVCAHEHVLLYRESFYWRKSVFSIIEFCNGGSLTSLRKVRLTEGQIRVLFRQLLKAVEYIHHNNIAHRDLKCANVMMKLICEEQGDQVRILYPQLKIGDFGLSCLMKDGKKELSMVGSRYWMSPEMIQRIGYGSKTDIYSLGCLMYELITGSAPYRSKGGLYSLFHHATVGCPTLSAEGYPDLYKSFLSAMVDKNPLTRYDATQLLNHKWMTSVPQEPLNILEGPLNTAYKTGFGNSKYLRKNKTIKNKFGHS